MSVYKWFYTYITPWWKRPLTYVRRDFYHITPLLNIVLFVSVGFFAGIFFPEIYHWVGQRGWHLVIIFAGAWLIGVIQGHFYWGKKYIEGQKGK